MPSPDTKMELWSDATAACGDLGIVMQRIMMIHSRYRDLSAKQEVALTAAFASVQTCMKHLTDFQRTTRFNYGDTDSPE